MFWGQTARGPFGVDPNTLTFPMTGGGSLPGDKQERFTMLGSATVDGNDLDVSVDQAATSFATGGLGAFDTSALPQRLNASPGRDVPMVLPGPVGDASGADEGQERHVAALRGVHPGPDDGRLARQEVAVKTGRGPTGYSLQ